MIESGLKTCKDDYCIVCAEAHSCDHECGFPCAAGVGRGAGGHNRRTLAEMGGWISTVDRLEAGFRCPLETLRGRLDEINEVCCGGGACEGDVPPTCPYECGRIWTSFFPECEPLLTALTGNTTQFAHFTDRCLDIDPASMAIALHGSICTVCGDGVVAGNEVCDLGKLVHAPRLRDV
eukprot:SAG11_NODE_4812_length_1758_cov_1.509946_2_plen_178_part_00